MAVGEFRTVVGCPVGLRAPDTCARAAAVGPGLKARNKGADVAIIEKIALLVGSRVFRFGCGIIL